MRRNIYGVSDASSISIGRILSPKSASEMTYTVSGGALNSTQSNPMMWFGHVQDNRSWQILSVKSASLVICAVPTPVKTTPELSRPAFGVLPETGDEELEDRGKPG